MGPQLYRCGNTIADAGKVEFNGLLQWGRNFIVAEISGDRMIPIVPYELQWGRNFIVAEII